MPQASVQSHRLSRCSPFAILIAACALRLNPSFGQRTSWRDVADDPHYQPLQALQA